MTSTSSENAMGGRPLGHSFHHIKAVRWFVIFRICFNARFYYPVFTVLFLDFGLTVSQFAILNAVWALTIVVLEVPSGALADLLGRRKLLLFTGATMVFEVGLLCFAPRGETDWLFPIFLLNRIASGAAEAAASGADEALAYDALQQAGLAQLWPRVLEVQMRWQSLAFVVAMLVGALVYDAATLGALLGGLGIAAQIPAGVALRLPLFLTWGMSFGALWAALRMVESLPPTRRPPPASHAVSASAVWQAFKITLTAGRWILATPLALMVILAGLVYDGGVRMVVTLSSQYYRLIGLPEASFGVIGALLALLGVVMPRLARGLAETRAPATNYLITGVLILGGLWGMTGFLPYWGLLPATLLFSSMYLTGFFVSHYLNRLAPSHQRATILSFKGLAFNLSYGGIGFLYAGGLALLRQNLAQGGNLTAQALEDQVFRASFVWFPWAFGVAAGIVLLAGFFILGRPRGPASKV